MVYGLTGAPEGGQAPGQGTCPMRNVNERGLKRPKCDHYDRARVDGSPDGPDSRTSASTSGSARQLRRWGGASSYRS